MAVIIVLILLLLLVLLVGAGFAFRLFRLERIERAGDQPAEGTPPEMGFPLQEEPGEQELVDLVEYFRDNKTDANEPAEEAHPPREEHDEPEFDPLFDFKVGRGFLADCQNALEAAREEDRIFAAAYFDLDRFRFINSIKGVATGDFVLTRLAQGIQDIFPPGSLYTRVSADHFAVLFPLIDDTVLQGCAEQIRAICEKVRDDIASKSNLRCCIGFAVTGSGRDYDSFVLQQKANIARHCLKVSKSEYYGMFDNSMLETYLFGESAVEDYSENQFCDELAIYYQPLLDLSKNRIIAADTLVRWSCVDSLGRAAPLTSDNGSIPTNNSKVAYQACRAIGRWQKTGMWPVPVMVGLSVTDLFRADIDEFFTRCLQDFQLEPSSLVVKIDIGIIRLDWSTATRQLKKLHDIGMQVAVCGIGRGSGLQELEGVPVDYIKLHKSFAADLKNSKSGGERRLEVEQMLGFARSLNLQPVFEGVDSNDQANLLSQCGARIIQGSFSGAPAHAEEFSKALTGLPSEVKKSHTVILNDNDLFRGDFRVF